MAVNSTVMSSTLSAGQSESCDAVFLPKSSLEAALVESNCVYQVYEEIASHFDQTRFAAWPGVSRFLNSLVEGSCLLDVGCGNGKYLLLKDELVKMGCDRCHNLCQVANNKDLAVAVADGLNLPFRSMAFDAALCIAVIHHFSTVERRRQSVEQICSVIKIGGRALIYVWAFEQERKKLKSIYLQKNAKKEVDGVDDNLTEDVDAIVSSDTIDDLDGSLPDSPLPLHVNRTPFVQQDVLVPWTETKSGVKHYRYYHVFREEELEDLCASVSSCRVVSSFYEQGNWAVVIEKIKDF